jgi:hypothetical protein
VSFISPEVFVKTAIALTLLLASNVWAAGPMSSLKASSVSALDKPTICSITLNSDDEISTFKTQIGEENANFIELTTVGQDDKQAAPAAETKNWFARACEAKIRCDVLIVSGHFGGTFFGKSGLSMPVETLEQNACEASCDGILQAPKEVYLFGCNTLAGKTHDVRTPEQYRQALLADDFTVEQAEEVVAYRYSPMGDSYADRMRRVFRGAQRIYGFDSIAPLGIHVRGLLTDYMKSAVPAHYYTRSNLSRLSTDQNMALAKALQITNLAQVSGDSSLSREQLPQCYLENPKTSFVDKLQWIDKNLRSDLSLSYVPVINEFFLKTSAEKHAWLPDESAVLDRISKNVRLRASLDHLVNVRNSAMLAMQVKLVSFMKVFGWLTEVDYTRRLENLILGDLSAPFPTERVDRICSFAERDEHVRFDITISMIPQARWSDSGFLRALGCIGSFNEEIMVRAIKSFESLSKAKRQLAGSYLDLLRKVQIPSTSMGTFSRALMPSTETLLSIINSKNNTDVPAAYWLLSKLKDPSPQAVSTLTQMLSEGVTKPHSEELETIISVAQDWWTPNMGTLAFRLAEKAVTAHQPGNAVWILTLASGSCERPHHVDLKPMTGVINRIGELYAASSKREESMREFEWIEPLPLLQNMVESKVNLESIRTEQFFAGLSNWHSLEKECVVKQSDLLALIPHAQLVGQLTRGDGQALKILQTETIGGLEAVNADIFQKILNNKIAPEDRSLYQQAISIQDYRLAAVAYLKIASAVPRGKNIPWNAFQVYDPKKSPLYSLVLEGIKDKSLNEETALNILWWAVRYFPSEFDEMRAQVIRIGKQLSATSQPTISQILARLALAER